VTDAKAHVAIGNKVVSLTRHVMTRENLSQDVAYSRLMGTDTFKLLSDPETRMFLEDDDYLFQCYDIESLQGLDALYAFVKPDP
jgi:hypothetical protein